ncbi:hypothetical protein ABGB07_38400 [Micromonosporaceae bacterium B7E4]
MTVTYEEAGVRKLRLRVVNYWARIEWSDGQPKLAEIREYDDSAKPRTDKQDPQLTEEKIFPLVRQEFKKCVSVRSSPMPPECPNNSRTTRADKIKWNLNGDPLINAKKSFDRPSGLTHVRGNYSITAAYNAFLIGPTSETDSGTYDAIISVDEGKPKVLRISRS